MLVTPTTARRAGLLACAAGALLVGTACSAAGHHVGTTDALDGAGTAASASSGSLRTVTPPSAGPVMSSRPAAPAASPDASDPADPPEDGPVALPASEPAILSVPAIGVESEVMRLGLQDNGMIEVPPYTLGSPAGWFAHSPTPGDLGPSVFLGHRNGLEGGPGVFAELPRMRVGDSIEVGRQDGSVARFTVYRTERFGKDPEDFPTLEVYGNTAGPEIRLITCDGLNEETRILEDNFIAYGRLDHAGR